VAKKKKPKRRKGRFVPRIFEHQLTRSRASKKAWQTRWKRSTGPVGPKGRAFLEEQYGEDFAEYDVAVTDDEYSFEERGRYPKKK
jgi:hypothetical protein